jgi:hypothetical protein
MSSSYVPSEQFLDEEVVPEEGLCPESNLPAQQCISRYKTGSEANLMLVT